ncbi:hypothetical protein ACQR1L_30110 [Bradyrhizobium sp. HKCCYLR20261]
MKTQIQSAIKSAQSSHLAVRNDNTAFKIFSPLFVSRSRRDHRPDMSTPMLASLPCWIELTCLEVRLQGTTYECGAISHFRRGGVPRCAVASDNTDGGPDHARARHPAKD